MMREQLHLDGTHSHLGIILDEGCGSLKRRLPGRIEGRNDGSIGGDQRIGDRSFTGTQGRLLCS